MENTLTLQSPRIRFNWGYWDGINDVPFGGRYRDLPIEDIEEWHHDQHYAAGYIKGRERSSNESIVSLCLRKENII